MTKKQKCILIVDDIQDVREELALLLTDEGYHSIQASNGIEALDSLRENKVDLLISDILMPEMDGIELSKAARTHAPELKIILISGGGQKNAKAEEYDYLSMAQKLVKIDHVLKKPVKPSVIIFHINQLLHTKN